MTDKKCPANHYYSKDSERCEKLSQEEMQLIKDLNDAWNDEKMSGTEVLQMLENKYGAEISYTTGGGVNDTLWSPTQLQRQESRKVMTHMFFDLYKSRVQDDTYYFSLGKMGNTSNRKILKKNIRVQHQQSKLGGF